jgi:cytochrome c oxidase subunit 1
VVAGASGPEEEHEGGHGIHLPLPSYWPLVAALGIPLIGYGLMFHWTFGAAGVITLLAGLYGWMLEPLE